MVIRPPNDLEFTFSAVRIISFSYDLGAATSKTVECCSCLPGLPNGRCAELGVSCGLRTDTWITNMTSSNLCETACRSSSMAACESNACIHAMHLQLQTLTNIQHLTERDSVPKNLCFVFLGCAAFFRDRSLCEFALRTKLNRHFQYRHTASILRSRRRVQMFFCV